MSGRCSCSSIEGAGRGPYDAFRGWDVGDIVAAQGLADAHQDRRTVGQGATALRLLTKSLRPLPDKFHGPADVEQRYRQRYVDLIVTEVARVFVLRSAMIASCASWLDRAGFLEVETPMMHPIPAARRAAVHHPPQRAGPRHVPARRAGAVPKRLVVGGFERVYEINRNFRNEGVSTRHNP